MVCELVTGPSAEPVTLEEMKAHLRVDGNDEDGVLAGMIAAAREWVEGATKRVLVRQVWRDYGDLRRGMMVLPKVPYLEVLSVTYVDAEGVSHVWDSSNYEVMKTREPALLAARDDADWPVSLRDVDPFCVEFAAGYGSGAATVPASLQLAVKLMASRWFEHRGDDEKDIGGAPSLVWYLIAPFRCVGVRA